MNWDFEGGLAMNYQTKSMGEDNELVELLWRNGQVFLQSQTTRKHVPNAVESGRAPRQDQPSLKSTNPNGTLGNSNGLIQDDETVSCIQFSFEDPFEKEFGSNLFSEFGLTPPIEAEKPIKHYEDKFVKFGAFDSTNVLTSSQHQARVDPSAVPNIPASHMPPPKFYHSDSSLKENNYGGSGKFTNFSQFSMPLREDLGSSNAHFGGERAGNLVQRDASQFSATTVGSSHCCSNQVSNDLDLRRISSSGIGAFGCASVPVKQNGGKMIYLSERKQRETLEPTLTSAIPNIPTSQMPPPKFYHCDSSRKENSYGGLGKFTNFSQFSMPLREGLGSSNAHFGGERAGNLEQRDARQFSAMTVGSSHCCSNQVSNDLDLSRISSSGIGASSCAGVPVKENGGKIISLSERKERDILDPTLTSSSGGSGSSSWRASKQSTDANSHKRKGKDKEESECLSEDGELESAAGDKQTRKSKSARRSRAAEIHNLSERRRRDRINEKMRTLQELIPHCNKTDKASLLDEAIEYTKSLQLQLQVMWMGGGMAAMMFPGVQHYMYRMGMGICPPPVPPNTMHLQRVPGVDHSMSMAANPNQAVPCQPPVLNPFNLQNQMQNPSLPEQYARYLKFHNMQNASQPLNMFRFGPQALSQGQTMPLPGSGSGAFSGGTVVNDS